MMLLGLIIVIVLACVVAIVYVTLAVNAEADRQDIIHEAPRVAEEPEAFRRITR